MHVPDLFKPSEELYCFGSAMLKTEVLGDADRMGDRVGLNRVRRIARWALLGNLERKLV